MLGRSFVLTSLITAIVLASTPYGMAETSEYPTGTLKVEIAIKGKYSSGEPQVTPTINETIDRHLIVEYEMQMIELGFRNFLDPDAPPEPEPEPIPEMSAADKELVQKGQELMASCAHVGDDSQAQLKCIMEKALAGTGKDMKFFEACIENPDMPDCPKDDDEPKVVQKEEVGTFEHWMVKDCPKVAVATLKDHGNGLKFHPTDVGYIPYSYKYDVKNVFNKPGDRDEKFCGGRMIVDTVGKTATLELRGMGISVILKEPPGPNDRESFFSMSTVDLGPQTQILLLNQPTQDIHNFSGQMTYKDGPIRMVKLRQNNPPRNEKFAVTTTLNYQFQAH